MTAYQKILEIKAEEAREKARLETEKRVREEGLEQSRKTCVNMVISELEQFKFERTVDLFVLKDGQVNLVTLRIKKMMRETYLTGQSWPESKECYGIIFLDAPVYSHETLVAGLVKRLHHAGDHMLGFYNDSKKEIVRFLARTGGSCENDKIILNIGASFTITGVLQDCLIPVCARQWWCPIQTPHSEIKVGGTYWVLDVGNPEPFLCEWDGLYMSQDGCIVHCLGDYHTKEVIAPCLS